MSADEHPKSEAAADHAVKGVELDTDVFRGALTPGHKAYLKKLVNANGARSRQVEIAHQHPLGVGGKKGGAEHVNERGSVNGAYTVGDPCLWRGIALFLV